MLMVTKASGHEPWRLIRGELKCTAHAQDQPSPWMVQYETDPEIIKITETLKPDVGKPSGAVSIPGHAVSIQCLMMPSVPSMPRDSAPPGREDWQGLRDCVPA